MDTKENCNNYLDYIINDELLKTQIFARLNTLIELRKKNETYINKIKEANKSIENSPVEGESMTEMIKKHMEGLSDGFNKETDLWKDLTEIVKNSVGPGPGSNSNLTILNQYYDYLATLTVEQQGALANILLAIVIFFCLITLISVFFLERC